MSTTTEPATTGRRSASGSAAGLRQWPALAAAWLLYGLALFWVFVAAVSEAPVSWGETTALFLFLLFVLAAEICALVLLNALLEAVTARLRGPLLLDLGKALALTALLALLVVSLVKYRATSVHLRSTDLWFAYHNYRQILQEALSAEQRGVLLLVATAAMLAPLLLLGLRRSRRLGHASTTGRVLLLALLAIAGASVCWASYRPVRLLGGQLLPELAWLRRSGLAAPVRLAGSASGTIAGPASGPPIVPYPPDSPPLPPPGALPNVLLLMLESVPWQQTSPGGGPPGLTPRLESLAAESVVFTRAYTPSTQSDYAQMAILSSLHPRKYEHHDFYVDLDYPRTLLWDALRPAGYASSMFSCQNERWGNMLRYLAEPGPDVLRYSLSWPAARRRGSGAESKVFEETPVAEWMAWRRAHPERPWLTYLNFQATHFPYDIPPEAPRPFQPDELDFPASFVTYPREKTAVVLNRFRNALVYADTWIGRVVDFLVASGEWEHTVLVVVSDHGQAFWEHRQVTHGSSFYEEQLRATLMIRIPGEPPREVLEPVSLLDVMPSLLERLGLPPHGNLQGRRDILDPGYDAAGRPLFFTLQGMTAGDGVLLDGWKYIVNWDRRQRELYDLATDPGEQHSLTEAEPARADALHRTLVAFLERQLAYYESRGWEAGRYPPPMP